MTVTWEDSKGMDKVSDLPGEGPEGLRLVLLGSKDPLYKSGLG